MFQARGSGDLLGVQFSISVFTISSSVFQLYLLSPGEVRESCRKE